MPNLSQEEHECLFAEEQEPDGRLILVPCLGCGTPAMEAIKHAKNIEKRLERAEAKLKKYEAVVEATTTMLRLEVLGRQY